MAPSALYVEKYNPENDKPKINVADAVTYAAKQSGRGVFEIGMEYWKLSKGPTKISPANYCNYRLFDSEKFSPAEKSEFIAANLHWKLVSQCNDHAWFAATEDKWLSALILNDAGIKTPETVAIIDAGFRSYGATTKLTNAEDLATYLTTKAKLPLFLKPVRGIASIGANIITHATKNNFTTHDGRTLEYHAIFDEIIGNDAFLLQTVVESHSFIKQYTPNVATIRMQNLLVDGSVKTPAAVIKIPSKNHVTDNVWREGNLVCNLDVDTGEILSAVHRDGFKTLHYTHHPETGKPLVGERLPQWDNVCEINKRAAKLFPAVTFQSQDIALTEDGPLVVEVNVGGSIDILQLAAGKGFMTKENQALFRACGCTIFN